MHATAMLQSVLAATPAAPAEEGIPAYLLAIAAYVIAVLFSPAWVWALYGLVVGVVHCFVGYRYLTLCIVMDLVAFGCGILLFMTIPGVIGSGLVLSLLVGTVIVMAVILYSKKYYPALVGFGWGVGLAVLAMWAIGIKPNLILALPFGIFGALFAWKRRRVAYIWMCATTGAKFLEWSVIVLVQTCMYGSFSILWWALRWKMRDGTDAPSRFDLSDSVKLWTMIGYVAVAVIGLVIQFKYADRWDYGKAGRPGKPVPDDEIPNIYPGADTQSHTGHGYVERPDASADKTSDITPEAEKAASD